MTIILGDCLQELPKIEPECAQIIICDLPYNIGKNFGNKKCKMNIDEYIESCKKWIDECLRILKKMVLCLYTANNCCYLVTHYYLKKYF